MAETFRKIRRGVWLGLNILVVLWLLAGVYCLKVPPQDFWPASFIAFSMPGALVLNLLFLLYWLLRRSWLVVLPLAALVLAWGYYGRLIALNFGEKDVPEGAKTLQVLSFNVHMFNAYAEKIDQEGEIPVEMMNWIATHPADVYCLQEFYSNSKSNVFNTINRIGVRYDKNRFFSVASIDHRKGDLGVAIFSKYPIVDKGVISFGMSSPNRVIWVDLNVEGDTVRVYASHLQSMSIKAEDIENTYSSIGNQQEMEKEGRNLARRLRGGFIARGKQVEQLQEHYTQSPHPFIICGDFNDIPFSYTYQVMAKGLRNAFEEAGLGIGATYNGPIPFLRIDNQFYSEGLRATDFKTHSEMGLSDHLPISATYVLEPKAAEDR